MELVLGALRGQGGSGGDGGPWGALGGMDMREISELGVQGMQGRFLGRNGVTEGGPWGVAGTQGVPGFPVPLTWKLRLRRISRALREGPRGFLGRGGPWGGSPSSACTPPGPLPLPCPFPSGRARGRAGVTPRRRPPSSGGSRSARPASSGSEKVT